MADPDDDLHELLGADPPPGVRGLAAAERGRLAELLRDSRRRQAATLEDAFAATVKHVPLPVRGIVKKVLMG